MKKINNYISEKLHISKNLKTDSIKIGMKIQSDSELYELIDFITADASDNEITAFLKKYKNVGNIGAWTYNIKNYKLTPEGRKSLDEFGYIMILKYIKYTQDYIMVYYNQTFFHPITEKLHIGKDYEVELTLDDFLQFFKDNDLYVNLSKSKKHAQVAIIMKYKDKTYPYIPIRLFDKYFQAYNIDRFDIYIASGWGDKLEVDDKFNFINNDKRMLTYNENNAKLIIDFLKNAKYK